MYYGTRCIYDSSTWILQGCRGRCAVVTAVASTACARNCSHRISRYSILGYALILVVRNVHVPCASLGGKKELHRKSVYKSYLMCPHRLRTDS